MASLACGTDFHGISEAKWHSYVLFYHQTQHSVKIVVFYYCSVLQCYFGKHYFFVCLVFGGGLGFHSQGFYLFCL